MSRKKLSLQNPNLEARLRQLWGDRQSIAAIAKKLKMSERSVYNYLKKIGISTTRQTKTAGLTSPHRHHYSCVAKWLRLHPGETLPITVKEICKLTRCSSDAVKTYLYRRRKMEQDFYKSIPDIRTLPLKIAGTMTKDFKNYKIGVSLSDLAVTINATLKDGKSFRAILPGERFHDVVKKAMEVTVRQPTQDSQEHS